MVKYLEWKRFAGLVVKALLLLILGLVSAAAQPLDKRGGISGTVTAEDGTVMSGVLVTYLLLQADLNVADPPGGGMVTAADGQFQFQNLRPGDYALCAIAAPYQSVLDTCEWTRSPQTVTLAAGGTITNVPIVLKHGEVLQFRIDDATKLLGNIASGKSGPSLVAGVWEPSGFFHALPLRSFDNTGQDLALVIPGDMLFHVTLAGQNFAIQNNIGTPILDAGAGLLLQIRAKTGPQKLTFVVQPVPADAVPQP